MTKPEISLSAVEVLLKGTYGDTSELVRLEGGAWSTAFGFAVGRDSFVARFGQYVEDFHKDQMAAEWSQPLLPIPEVIEIGLAFAGAFAVSRRHFGEKLDELPPDRLSAAIESLMNGLSVLGDVELPGEGFGGWKAPSGDAFHPSWAEYLVSVPQRHDARLEGWRDRLLAVKAAQSVFEQAQATLEQLAPYCPSVRKVIHGDLLYGNVLVSPDNQISAVFDWGNSLAGDPLYDISWLIFWSPWHRGIDPGRVRKAAAEQSGQGDFEDRLRCYQLHIGLDGMQYQAFAGLHEDLAETAAQVEQLL